MDPELLQVLACPQDQGDLHYRQAEEILVCSNCATEYPVRDGIPILLLDESTPGRVDVSPR